MNADALRDAITREMMDYRRPKLLTSQSSYILHPVTVTSCCSNSPCNNDKCLSVTVNTSSPSQPSTCIHSSSTDVIDVSSADSKMKPEVPEICTAAVDVDGNTVEMPSASTCRQAELPADDVTMLSARSVTNSDVQLKEQICLDTIVNSSNHTCTATIKDNRTDSTVSADDLTVPVIKDSQCDCNPLVINTDLPAAADAKARIKAALLNSGRRRQRRGK